MEYPQSPGRMTPATARFYEAVVNGQLTHSGDSRLARHVGNAVLREDARGARLAKERKDSPWRIDAAVAAVMAHDRAAALAGSVRDSIYNLTAQGRFRRHSGRIKGRPYGRPLSGPATTRLSPGNRPHPPPQVVRARPLEEGRPGLT
jgi:Phage Terminase